MRRFAIHILPNSHSLIRIVIVALQDIINNIYRILSQGRLHASLSTQYHPDLIKVETVKGGLESTLTNHLLTRTDNRMI